MENGNKNISYPEARKLIVPEISQRSSTATTTTQTDKTITKILQRHQNLIHPLIDTAPATSNSLCTSVASPLSNKVLPSSTGSIVSPLPAEASHVLEFHYIQYNTFYTPDSKKTRLKLAGKCVLANLLPHSHSLT
ncbi:hypothetical protein TNCV_4026901 [Trichonephila clavipes]|nr:hypothetical protein TNCV_4026901 [Trichonephila clavipes]